MMTLRKKTREVPDRENAYIVSQSGMPAVCLLSYINVRKNCCMKSWYLLYTGWELTWLYDILLILRYFQNKKPKPELHFRLRFL